MNELTLRSARPHDVDFCERLYYDGMSRIIEELRLDPSEQRASFPRHWRAREVRIVACSSEDVGWLQTAPRDYAIFLGQLYVDGRFRNRGIGTWVVRTVIDEAAREGKAVTLGVIKINPARRLYERMGFRMTHEGEYEFYMRREPEHRAR